MDPHLQQAIPERPAASSSPPPLRWRRVFPGEARELSVLRRWVTDLLPAGDARDDVVVVTVELATNTVKWTASGRAGHFAVEITWYGETIRVAVADGGGPTAPHLIDDPLADHGRGLAMVRALSTRMGVCGDQRGRLVWAEVPWAGTGAVAHQSPGDAYEIAVQQDEAALARRFTGAAIWFGRCTLQWWALPGPAWGDRLLTAPSARELAELLDRTLRPSGRLPHAVADDPETAREAHGREAAPAVHAPARSRRGPARVPQLGTQPC